MAEKKGGDSFGRPPAYAIPFPLDPSPPPRRLRTRRRADSEGTRSAVRPTLSPKRGGRRKIAYALVTRDTVMV